jgi:hypothetical protein
MVSPIPERTAPNLFVQAALRRPMFTATEPIMEEKK